jgi:hypothetical protein
MAPCLSTCSCTNLSCCFVKYLECLDKLCLEIDPATNWVLLQQRVQFRIGPSHAMMKDLTSATSSPPAEFTADSYLMRNCLEFPKLLYFGRETGLNFGGHGASLQPYWEWWFWIHELQDSITHEEIFFRGSSVLARILVWWVLPQWVAFLFFHFYNFSLHSFDLLFCLIKFF